MFSSLVKQNTKAKFCFVIHIAGEKKLLFYFYFVIVKQNFMHAALITTTVFRVYTCKYPFFKLFLIQIHVNLLYLAI